MVLCIVIVGANIIGDTGPLIRPMRRPMMISSLDIHENDRRSGIRKPFPAID
jgi:hypothetical protein